MHQHGFPKRWATAGAAFQIDRRLHVDERQWHEFCEAARLRLQPAQSEEMSRPMDITIDVTVHDRRRCLKASAMGGTHHFEPARGINLVGAKYSANFVVEHFGGGARQGSEPGVLQAKEEFLDRETERGCALMDLERRKRVNMHTGTASRTARQISR